MAPGVKCLAASGMLLRTISRDMPLGPTAHMSWPEISRGYDENNPDIHRQQAIAIAIRTRPGERGFSIIGVGRSWRTSSAADKLSTGATPPQWSPTPASMAEMGEARGLVYIKPMCFSRGIIVRQTDATKASLANVLALVGRGRRAQTGRSRREYGVSAQPISD